MSPQRAVQRGSLTGLGRCLPGHNSDYQAFYAYQLGQMRHYDDAIAQARKALVMPEPFDPSFLHEVLWRAFHQKRMYQEALAEAKALFTADPEIVEALSRGYAEGGYAEANRRAAERLAARNTLSFWERENVTIPLCVRRAEGTGVGLVGTGL